MRTGCCLCEALLNYLLENVSRFPGCEFWATELQERFGGAMDRLVASRLLRPLPIVAGKLIYPCRTKVVCEAAGREVVETGGRMWAVCTCPAEEPPHEIAPRDLQRYGLDVSQLAHSIATKNNLRGQSRELENRMWFLGDCELDGQSVAWVLGLLRDEDESLSLIESLLARLPTSYQTLIVLTASLALPPDVVVRLNGLGVFVLAIPTHSDLQVSPERLAGCNVRRASDPASWPDEYFKDEDGVWLNAKILKERYAIPDSRLKEWREKGCPALNGRRLTAKKVGGAGWVYLRMFVNQVANRRDDQGKVEAKLDLAARLDAGTQMKRDSSAGRKPRNSR